MNFGTLILDYAWHQAVVFFLVAVGTAGAAIVLSRFSAVAPWRLLCAATVSVMFAWIGLDTMTSSTRIDARGVTIDSPLDLVQRHAFLSWHDMIGAEIVPQLGLWHRQGLRLVSRTGADIVIPIGAMASKDIPLVLDHVAAQPTARMIPNVGIFFAQAERIVQGFESRKLRARAAYEHMAFHWFQSSSIGGEKALP
jgi:hypothetical protein